MNLWDSHKLALSILVLSCIAVAGNIVIPGRFAYDFYTSFISPRETVKFIGRYFADYPDLRVRQDYYIVDGTAFLYQQIYRADLNVTITDDKQSCSIEPTEFVDFGSELDIFRVASWIGKTIIDGEECNLYRYFANGYLWEGCILDDNITVVFTMTNFDGVTVEINMYNFCSNASIDLFHFDHTCTSHYYLGVAPQLLKLPIVVRPPPVPPAQFSSDVLFAPYAPNVNSFFGRVWVNEKDDQIRFDTISWHQVILKFTSVVTLIADWQRDKVFVIDQMTGRPTICEERPFSASIFNFYLWLPLATYLGDFLINKPCSMWQFDIGQGRLYKACFSLEDNSTVVWASEISPTAVAEYYFHNFCSHRVTAQTFTRPEIVCSDSTSKQAAASLEKRSSKISSDQPDIFSTLERDHKGEKSGNS